MLLGRREEQETIDRVLAAARDGMSGVIVLRGDPGIGKTALLDDAVDSAEDLQVSRVAGIESERELGFAALHRLLLPFLAGIEDLPDPQRDALSAAFGLVASPPADRFLVSLAVLTLLADVAAVQPLVCVVDDVQWLDRESIDVLAFVARRLHADGLALLFAVRDPTEQPIPLDGLPRMDLAGLPPDESRALLAESVAGQLDQHVATRLLAETDGNPLALVELASELTSSQLAGGVPLPVFLPVGERIERRFLRQVDGLPPASQTLLLIAAAESEGDPAAVAQAASQLGIAMDAADPLDGGGLLVLSPRVEFRHPLIRSAVYGGAPIKERRRVHAALAEVTDRVGNPDRRAWHLAAAAVGPDEAVAAELALAADRARLRGGYAATAALLTRSAQLTPADSTRAERLVAAAQAALNGGEPTRAQLLLDEAMPHLTDERHRAEAQRLEGAIRAARGQAAETLSILLAAARALKPFDVHQARETLLDAFSAAVYSGRFGAGGMLDIANEARATPLLEEQTATNGDLLLDGLAALFTDGHAEAAPRLREAIAALDGGDDRTYEALRWLGFGCLAAGVLGDNETLHKLASRLERRAREQGALIALTRGLYFLAMSELVAGSLGAAGEHFAETREIMAARGDPAGLGQVMVLAWSGREGEARAEAAEVMSAANERGQAGVLVTYAEYALGVLELSLGNYREALNHASTAHSEDSFSYFLSTMALPDLVEAGTRGDDLATAGSAVDQLAERATVNGTSLSLGLLARSRALVADPSEAEDLYREAIDQLAQGGGVGNLARAHLLYGEWLRRQNRRVDAREQLRTAHEMFTAMGADGFAERTRIELLATGEHARKRSAETRDDLTPQEAQIARLASERATNREIAAQMFISANTVEYHLRKVFRKLGINSRRDLPEALRNL